jgi:hypothetical protein
LKRLLGRSLFGSPFSLPGYFVVYHRLTTTLKREFEALKPEA